MRSLMVVVVLCAVPAFADFKRLYASEASASSHLRSNWNKFEENYHPSYALDDDPKTAWLEGADGDGVGETLTVKLSALETARALKLVIFDGYQKSKGLFAANSTPTRLEVTVTGPGGGPSARKELKLAAKMGPQTFEVPLTAGLASVTLKVLEVKPGTRYRDTCISDVQFFVDSDVPYDARVEQARRDKLLNWKKERVKAAKYFASLPESYPFASASFSEEKEQRTLQVAPGGKGKPDWDALLAQPIVGLTDRERDGLLKARHPPALGRCFNNESLHVLTLPEMPSRLLDEDERFFFSDVIQTGDFALSEAKQQNCLEDGALTRGVFLIEGTAAQPVRAFETRHYTFQARSTSTEAAETYLLEWENGYLSRIYNRYSMYVFFVTDGKIDTIDHYVLEDGIYQARGPHIQIRRSVASPDPQ